MTELNDGDYIPLKEVPRLIPYRKNGKPVHISTVWRWASRGVRGCRLKTWKLGGATCTTKKAIDQFIHEMNNPKPSRTIKRPNRRERPNLLGEGRDW